MSDDQEIAREETVVVEAGFWNCVREVGTFGSFQNMLYSATGSEWVKNSWVVGAVLGNPYSDGIEAFGDIAEGDWSGGASDGSRSAVGFFGDKPVQSAGEALDVSRTYQKFSSIDEIITMKNGTRFRFISGVGPLVTITKNGSRLGKGLKAVAGGMRAVNLWNAAVSLNGAFVCGIYR